MSTLLRNEIFRDIFQTLLQVDIRYKMKLMQLSRGGVRKEGSSMTFRKKKPTYIDIFKFFRSTRRNFQSSQKVLQN